MKSRVLATVEKLLVPLLVVAMVVVLVFTIASDNNDQSSLNTGEEKQETSSYVQSYSTLTYCSEWNDVRCQDGVMKLSYKVTDRNDVLTELYGYDETDDYRVKLASVEVKLNGKTEDLLNSEACIYEDTDKNTVLNVSIDNKLSCATLAKKTVLFEDMNVVLDSKKPPGSSKGLIEENFFITTDTPQAFSKILDKDDEGERVELQFIRSIKVTANNISDDNKLIFSYESFADRSLFTNISEINLNKSEFLEKNGNFKTGPDNIVMLEGDNLFEETVIVPKGLLLKIMPGSVLRIAPEVNFVSYSPALIEGTEDNAITIKSSSSEPYGVFSILGSTGSDFVTKVNYLNVSNGSQAEVNGAFMSGMFNVYRNKKVVISNSVFSDAKADDGLNIKNSEIDLRSNTFISNSADAFDGDFVNGRIENNIFIDNGNDSLDFSGSDISPTLNIILSSGDKCVSVGEGTKINLYQNILDGCSIGVEVKDRSDAVIRDNYIANSTTYALNSYVKKAFFGTPSSEYYDNIMINNKQQTSGLIDKSSLSNNRTEQDIEIYLNSTSWLQKLWSQRP